MIDLKKLRPLLQESGFDGWLLYDFRGSNPTARRALDLEKTHITRRFFCLLPREGEPRWLVSKMEEQRFEGRPGSRSTFRTFEELKSGLGGLLAGARRVAMEYSPGGGLPHVSSVDGGTLDLVKATGVEVASSADLTSHLFHRLTKAQLLTHRRAAKNLIDVVKVTLRHAAAEIRAKGQTDEFTLQQFILKEFEERGLVPEHPPIVGTREHSSDPHFEPTATNQFPVREGDILLLDIFAREKRGRSVQADITWMACAAERVPDRFAEVFAVDRDARDAALRLVTERAGTKQKVQGLELDRAARSVIERAGYGDSFIHRTGHNLAREVHGPGPNIDGFETLDTRTLMPGMIFTIEPGIYLPEFGVRTEINVLMNEDGAEVTTLPLQKEIVPFLRADFERDFFGE